ncbi:MAG: hypothetical protein ACRD2O_08065 [Terriglobia bacterium]
MELSEAIGQANAVLDEERVAPTVRYSTRKRMSSAVGPEAYPDALRHGRPRSVLEDPEEVEFASDNYTLLCAIVGRLPQEERDAFSHAILARIHTSPACGTSIRTSGIRTVWDNLTSELPLLAEFSVRSGARTGFIWSVGEASPAPGHVLLLHHLADMIAFNYALFSEEDYDHLLVSIASLKATGERHLRESPRSGWRVAGPEIAEEVRADDQARKVDAAVKSLTGLLRRAKHLHLKRSLLPGVNLEVNQDKRAVESYLQTLGFSEALRNSLNEAERLYRDQGDGFSLKSSMGHLRSFLEGLHREKLPALHAKYGGVVPSGWADGLVYLRNNGVISAAEEKFIADLYGVMSDEGVHPLITDREYARLSRNIVIEYGLLFLRNIEKLGLGACRR